jgi:redox-sensitive bicupin YhaK (pirin superfamily)
MPVLQQIQPRVTDLSAGLQVRRVLPSARQRSVGPFVFFDHFGPVSLAAEANSDVGPHPHIGLATVTYLFEGRFVHRDSLGTVQDITPGAINWMSAGRGIVHSERTPPDPQGRARRLHGLQLWVALPREQEQGDPAFQHVAAEQIPEVEVDGAHVRVLVGQAFDAPSPVRAASPTLYLDITLQAGGSLALPPLAEQLAVYSPQLALGVDGQAVPGGEMAVLDAHAATLLQAGDAAVRFVVIGGAALEQPRAMWWNFVSTDRALIEQAARRWEADGFDPIPGETGRVAAPAWRGLRA